MTTVRHVLAMTVIASGDSCPCVKRYEWALPSYLRRGQASDTKVCYADDLDVTLLKYIMKSRK